MSTTFNHYLVELTAISSERLRDTDALSALVVAAAGAVGMPGLGPPVARQGAGEGESKYALHVICSYLPARSRSIISQ